MRVVRTPGAISRKAFLGIASSIVVLPLLGLYAIRNRIETVRAASAATFVHSIGVNTHFNYFDTSYANFPLLEEKLAALGVRHCRDHAHLPDNELSRTIYDRYRALAAFGVRFALIVDPRNQRLENLDSRKIAGIAEMSGNTIWAFEAPNEFDLLGVADWPERLRAYQKDLYESVKGNPSTVNVPVLGPSMAHAENALAVGDISTWLDYGNMHPYPGGQHPGYPGLDNYNIENSRIMCGQKPFASTETGYHNAMRTTDQHPPVSERAAGKYIPRMFFEYFNRGIRRTYAYELVDLKLDPELGEISYHFGLLRADFTEKPAYRALKNMIALLKDAPHEGFSPGSLEFSLSGGLGNDVHHTLLQKGDSTFWLAIWNEVPSYDLANMSDLYVAEPQITLSFAKPFSEARIYRPGRGTFPVSTHRSISSLELPIPDEVLLIEIRAG